MKIFHLQDPIYTSNVYLIDAERPVLIDTGGSLKDQLPGWVSKQLGGKRLSAILFTHGHPDHIQGAEELAQVLNVPMYIDAAETDKVPTARALGERVDCGDAVLEVLQTPGHSPGGVSFYEPKSKTLICGDAIFPGGRTGRWDLPGSNHADLVDSVRRLSQLQVNALYAGHYAPLFDKIASHMGASLETLRVVGEAFDEARYDARIAALQIELSL